MRRGIVMSLSLAMWLAAATAPALARITVDEARSIVEKTFGISLEGVEAQAERGPVAEDQRAVFRVAAADGPVKYTVDLELGSLLSYDRPSPDFQVDDRGQVTTPFAVDRATAREIALAEARRVMGPAFELITEWRESALGGPVAFTLRGGTPAIGDPPHVGLTPRASVVVSLVDGSITRFGQFIPIAADPIPPKIGKDEAVRIAAERLGQPDAKPDKDPTLYQDSYGRGELTWMVRFVTFVEQKEIGPDGKETVNRYPVGHLYTIDALTGEIVKEE